MMNRFICAVGKPLKQVFVKFREHRKYATKYRVEGIVQNKEKMLYVLSGYKPYLWEDVFSRIKKYQPYDMEVCIGSSGKYCEELSKLCSENGWVYVSTKLNNVCVISNIIIRLFPNAEYIYKLDEDIYLPKNYFNDLFQAYKVIEKEIPADIGYICPELPLGWYGMHEFLIRNNCLEEFESKFGIHKIGARVQNPSIRQHNGIDEFIWEKIGVFDKKAKEYHDNGFSYEKCGARSRIAAILFTRRFWNRMGGLRRPLLGIGVGDWGDEGQITSYCALNFQMMICVKNILVGHFAFGGAEKNVLRFKEKHPEIFALHEDI